MRVSLACATTCTVLAGLLAVTGCGSDGPAGPSVLYTLSVRAGDGQTGPAGSLLDEPLQVSVRDPANEPARGVRVRFRLVGGRGGQLVDTMAVTGPDGVAVAHLRAGATGDTATVTAAVPGQEDRGVTFRAVATAGAALATVAPATFAPGDTITVRGARFNASPAGNAVYFGGARGRIVRAEGDSLLRVVVPPCLAAGALQVTVRLGSATTNPVGATVAGVGAPLRLAAFEATTVSGTEPGSCLVLAPGARYLLVPQFASVGAGAPASRTYVLGIDSIVAALGKVATAPTLQALLAAAPSAGTRERLDRFLRAEERRIARELVAAGLITGPVAGPRGAPTAPPRAGVASQIASAPEPPPLGSVRTFRVLNTLDPPAAFTAVAARLRFAGTNVLVYEDQRAPEPLSDAALLRLGNHFDRTLHPIDVAAFGSESDIDGNGRVIVLMSPVVNALTPASGCGNGFAPGFFYPLDFDTRNQNSNRGEIFYAFVADPRGERSCPHTLSVVERLLPATFLHEFQHMISFNQHVLVRGGSEEDPWLNEGLSHIAEELGARHYAARFPAPTGRSIPTQLYPDSAIKFISGNVENAGLYLSNPAISSVTTFAGFGTLEERGAAWLFLRWLAAQKGEGVYTRLVQTSRTSRRNVEEVAGETFAGLFGDFAIALWADSIPGQPRAVVPARYRFAGPSLRELFVRIEGRPRYPIVPRATPAVGATATGALVEGTFDFYDVTVTRPGGVAVRFSAVGGGAFPANVEAQIGVLRLTP